MQKEITQYSMSKMCQRFQFSKTLNFLSKHKTLAQINGRQKLKEYVEVGGKKIEIR